MVIMQRPAAELLCAGIDVEPVMPQALQSFGAFRLIEIAPVEYRSGGVNPVRNGQIRHYPHFAPGRKHDFLYASAGGQGFGPGIMGQPIRAIQISFIL
jgi:hypothetical protein